MVNSSVVSDYNVFKVIFASFLCILAIFPETVICGEQQADNAFGDPEYAVNMDESWKYKSITHDEKLGNVDLVISLGQQTYPALHQFVEDFAKRRGIKIVIQQGTCGVSAKKLALKAIDMGAYCCPPGNTDRLPGIEFHTIGIAPIALITNIDNEISDLSLAEARNIFSGRTQKWSEVPVTNKIQLPRKDIQPVVRLHCKKRPGHWRQLLDNENMFSARIHEVGVIPDMIKEVSDAPDAIGYETLYMLDVYKDSGNVKVLSIDGLDPSDIQNLESADYPFYRSFSLTTWSGNKTSNKLSQELLASIQQHIEEHGDRYGIIPSSKLRLAGWKFKGDELIGEPTGKKAFSEHD
jgi:ABC-type phosphate transport system substrate-binding protein